MMRLAAPEWIILLPLLAALGFAFPGLGFMRPLRALALVLIVLVLARPEIRTLADGLDLFVLVDRSASSADTIARQLPEWETLLERSRGPNDRMRLIDFAEFPVERADGTDSGPGSLESTHLRLALQYALGRQDPDRAARILALTDGFSTEPLDGIGEVLARQEVALDYRWTNAADADDAGVVALETPPRVQPGEPFLISVRLSGRPDGDVPMELLRDGVILQSTSANLDGGRGEVRFTDRLVSPGAHRYSVRLTAPDAISGNNMAESWVEVAGSARILLVSAYADDPLASVLSAQGFDVEVAMDVGKLDVGRLAGARAVILNNVPAYEIPNEFLDALDFYVRSQAGGLLMVGGKTSFGSGGYFRSAIDELLPVSMELRTEHRKLAVAMAIVMDRSGSMGAQTASGVSKMDLANEGAARAIDLLGPADAVTVFAVDTQPHVIVPLTRLDENRAVLTNTVRTIQSGGGGIYVYNGLKTGWDELQKSDAGQRHIILFADAADAEQPDDYVNLLAEMTAAGASVSVIGLGSPADSDGAFLEDVAKRGGGRIFFNADAATLPVLFEQETVALARSAFLEEPVGMDATAGWLELAARPIEWPEAVDGYNLSYLRPNATGAAFSRDEYQAPLVAFWQRGAGRAAAVSFPLGGPASERVRAWSGYGDFIQTLGRWLIGSSLPPGLGLQTRVNGNTLELDLRFDAEWQDRFARTPPEIIAVDGATSEPRSIVWERLQPGHYRARLALSSGQWTRGAVRAGEYTIPFGPIAAGLNHEWTFDPARRSELAAAATISGGRERVDLSQAWAAPRRNSFHALQTWLLTAFLLVFLADAFVTRLGYRA